MAIVRANETIHTMYKSEDYINCKNEQQFKNLYCKKALGNEYDCFNIETEETCKGFPDVLAMCNRGASIGFLLEFKYANKGIIKFQPTQPAFYKKYQDLSIQVIAYNPDSQMVHVFKATEILNEDSIYYTHGKATINLNKAESK